MFVPPDPARVQSVFRAAVEIGDPSERAAHLNAACADDEALRQRVEALLIHVPVDCVFFLVGRCSRVLIRVLTVWK